MKSVGIAGLGQMGSGMTRQLLRAGFRVVVFDVDPGRVAAAVAAGAEAAPSAGNTAVCGTVITMLPSERIAIDAVAAPGGIGDRLPPGGTHVLMGTVGLGCVETIETEHRRRAQHFVLAPVFGRPEEAAAGDLTIVASRPGLDAVRDVLGAFGPRLHEVESTRAACVAKLAGNELIGSAVAAMAEGFALAAAAGVPPPLFHQIITGKLFQGAVYRGVGGSIASGNLNPPDKFAATLGLKDMKLALAAAERLAVDAPLAKTVARLLEDAIAAGHAERDWAVMAHRALGRLE